MRTLYIECNMGLAGDMLNAALYELLPEEKKQEYISTMNSLGLPGVKVEAVPAEKCGVHGTHMKVTVGGEEELSIDVNPGEEAEAQEKAAGSAVLTEHHHGDDDHDHEHHHDHHHHHHTSMAEITDMIKEFDLPPDVKERAAGVYEVIAEAESEVHGMTLAEVHFHEVGSMDAVADVVGASLLISLIAPEKTVISPICTGFGKVRCAHGILPVPAPATAKILSANHIPFYAGNIRGELLTPTGAALAAVLADEFGNQPAMTADKIGVGCGNKDFEAANIVRAMLGESSDGSLANDEICELACNLDDMTPEEIGFTTGKLMEDGALDVYTTNIGMKKNRPGIILTCMCRSGDRERFVKEMFRLTTTLGIREYTCRRYRMERAVQDERSFDGVTVHRKVSRGFGASQEKLEYEDIAAVARKENISLREAREKISSGKETDKKNQ